jgi:N-acetylglucosaminyldiphosphoundecaprenol N-acetyl-beta-D-mannosaminyltransferase
MNALSLPAHIRIQGIPLINLDMDEALAAVEAALIGGKPIKVAFANADCANIAARNSHYRDDLAAMDWIFADGIGLRIAGKLLRAPVRANVNGTDLFPLLCDSLARSGKRLYLLGARPGVAAAAAAWAQNRYPGLQIAGTRHGYFSENEITDITGAIRASCADVLLVALGTPRQEAWIKAHTVACGVTLAMGVGGLFDYYSGRIPRAPAWMRRCGLEWVFRLIQEPGRLWRRYLLGNAVFLARTGRDWFHLRTQKPARLRSS